ncbi:exocyst complex component 5-like, partial [Saccoglossus kowalevskii]|uniref:Exocyst complex component 5 n=1 Tax=Saccoglossus kowalevskii TaxID=10224 RepID=A0ABM0GPR4_SACKO
EPFSGDDYVERLAWNVQGGTTERGPESFDPQKLLLSFGNTIEELKLFGEKVHKRIEKLEQTVQTEYNRHAETLVDLQKNQQGAFSLFHKLDERINGVATKVVHLGDQLEGVNIPRQRAVEAQKLMKYFSEFLSDKEQYSDIFTDPFQLQEAADVIQKLQLISQELPQERFGDAKERIDAKCLEIERDLISEFKSAHTAGDTQRMKDLATILLHFKGYSDCIDAFIEESQKPLLWHQDLFPELLSLCQKVNKVIMAVFISAPETVMGKFVLNIYKGKLQEVITEKLSNQIDSEMYLKNLSDLYGRLHDLQARIRNKTNINIGHTSTVDYGGETFLSQSLALSLLNESKQALLRCELLSSQTSLPLNATEIFYILVDHLCYELIDYALDVGLQ